MNKYLAFIIFLLGIASVFYSFMYILHNESTYNLSVSIYNQINVIVFFVLLNGLAVTLIGLNEMREEELNQSKKEKDKEDD